jgi:hypothetical protein
MGEGAIHCCFILDVRKKTNGQNVDLDETELSLLVGRIPDECNGLSREIIMDLRCVKILNERDSGLMVPMVAMVFSLIPPIKSSKKLLNLKTWSGAPVMSDLLGT